MAPQVFVYVAHRDGQAADSALELLSAARVLSPDGLVIAMATGWGAELDQVCREMTGRCPEVWKLAHEALAYPNAEAIRKCLSGVLPSGAVLLLAHDTLGMDLGPGLSIKLDSPFVSDVVAMDPPADGALKLVREEYGGQVSTHLSCDISGGAVLSIRSGSFPASEETAAGEVRDKSSDIGDLSCGRRFIKIVEAEAGDVDITKEEILVSVGRGIEDEDNIEIAEDLAKALGGVVSCSRPIVDAKWLEKPRQVGTSGKTVKPKVYLALGISGSFQHLGGLKGNPFIVAVNKNPKAPIFQVADVGVVDDLLEFVPLLTERIDNQ
ncbi:MAG: electron transfer flavoprotein subunit alpha/FixB family protein [Proteobacteria bacterium]|nr:electron transfer flavoprotein subunit alpha/FixB family protein [Pseudomonadota bacterium]MBU4275442.1 electron transfer flavoprotein subunit alpha/FixB family protein [Pseudomonadota bacterium]MBU4382719.1 electron transfer flavoprotein subunit alpha/FixB family protein [Pseudomonadota bacterium]MBU4603948.1 electron transfer flavoprotein subunit alpha/FixB family protein [Pseudomonadota bacterium]MCG2765233.1 electron transfer flavoprotein subunit alpha/FixB family protein [Desulfarculace